MKFTLLNIGNKNTQPYVENKEKRFLNKLIEYMYIVMPMPKV